VEGGMSKDAKLILWMLVAVTLLALAGIAIEQAVFEADTNSAEAVAERQRKQHADAGRRPKENSPARDYGPTDSSGEAEGSSDREAHTADEGVWAGRRKEKGQDPTKETKEKAPSPPPSIIAGTPDPRPTNQPSPRTPSPTSDATPRPASSATASGNEPITINHFPIPTSSGSIDKGLPVAPQDNATKAVLTLASAIWRERGQAEVSKLFNAIYHKANEDDGSHALAAWILLSTLTTPDKSGNLPAVDGVRIDQDVARHLAIIAGHMPAGPLMHRVYAPLARSMQAFEAKPTVVIPKHALSPTDKSGAVYSNFEARAAEVMAARVLMTSIAITGRVPEELLSLLGYQGETQTVSAGDLPKPTNGLVYLLLETMYADPGFGNREYLKYSQRIDLLSPSRNAAFIGMLEAISGKRSKQSAKTKQSTAPSPSLWAPHVAALASHMLSAADNSWDATIPEQFWERDASAPIAPQVFVGTPAFFFETFKVNVARLTTTMSRDEAIRESARQLEFDTHEGNIALEDLAPSVDPAIAALASMQHQTSHAEAAAFLASLAPRFRRGLYQRDWNPQDPLKAKETWASSESRGTTLSATQASSFDILTLKFSSVHGSSTLSDYQWMEVIGILMQSDLEASKVHSGVSRILAYIAGLKESDQASLRREVARGMQDRLLVSYIKLAPQASKERGSNDHLAVLALLNAELPVLRSQDSFGKLDSFDIDRALDWLGAMGYLTSGSKIASKSPTQVNAWYTMLAIQYATTVTSTTSKEPLRDHTNSAFLVRERLLYAGIGAPSF